MNAALCIAATCLTLLAVYIWRKRILRTAKKVVMPMYRWSGYWLTLASASTVLLAVCVLLLCFFGAWGYYTDVEANFQNAVLKGISVVFQAMEGDWSTISQYYPNHRNLTFLLFTAVPCLMVSTAVLFLVDFFPKPLPTAEEYCIFSQVDERSLLFAEDLIRQPIHRKLCIIFLRVDRDSLPMDFARRLKIIQARAYPYVESELLEIHFYLKKQKLRFYFISSDTDKNFDQMESLLNTAEAEELFQSPKDTPAQHYQQQENRSCYWQEMYLLSETESAPMLIDHLRLKLCDPQTLGRKPVFAHTDLRLLDRYRMVTYQLLQDKPLYETAKDHSIRVLVLGFGKVGQAFFRAAVSFCAIDGYSCSFHLCDREIYRHWETLRLEYPECGNCLRVTMENLDAESTELIQMIERNGKAGTPFTYIMLSLGEDERNIRIACALKRYFRKCYWLDQETHIPAICVNVENNIKSTYVPAFYQNILVRSGNTSQVTDSPLYVFGDNQSTFSEKIMMQRGLWTAARKLHTKLKSDDFSYWPEYERRSSIASAAHAHYHVETFSTPEKYQETYDQLSEAHQRNLLDAEHRRWMHYVRSEGMQYIPVKIAKEYQAIIQYHVDPIGKLTPCIVPTAKLKEVYKTLYPKDTEFKNVFTRQDELVIRNAHNLSQIISGINQDFLSEK